MTQKHRKDMDGQNVCSNISYRRSRYFLMTMKTDSTGWDIDVTIESPPVPQSFLNMPLGNFYQNQ